MHAVNLHGCHLTDPPTHELHPTSHQAIYLLACSGLHVSIYFNGTQAVAAEAERQAAACSMEATELKGQLEALRAESAQLELNNGHLTRRKEELEAQVGTSNCQVTGKCGRNGQPLAAGYYASQRE